MTVEEIRRRGRASRPAPQVIHEGEAFRINGILHLEVETGTFIEKAIAEAIRLARILPVAQVEFEFNGIPVVVTPISDVETVEAQWRKDTDTASADELAARHEEEGS